MAVEDSISDSNQHAVTVCEFDPSPQVMMLHDTLGTLVFAGLGSRAVSHTRGAAHYSRAAKGQHDLQLQRDEYQDFSTMHIVRAGSSHAKEAEVSALVAVLQAAQ